MCFSVKTYFSVENRPVAKAHLERESIVRALRWGWGQIDFQVLNDFCLDYRRKLRGKSISWGTFLENA